MYLLFVLWRLHIIRQIKRKCESLLLECLHFAATATFSGVSIMWIVYDKYHCVVMYILCKMLNVHLYI